ncbi:MAG: prepilin-type N-terminal cleavage/methylation domain-containing protein [Terrimicrobiaceae bacterium]
MKSSLHSHLKQQGFSLVEVVIAIGVIAFAVLAMLGLFQVAIRSGGEAAEKMSLSRISRSVFDSLPSRDWSKVAGSSMPPGSTGITGFAALRENLAAGNPFLLRFDNQGNETGPSSEARYEAKLYVDEFPFATLASPPTAPAGLASPVLNLRLHVEWPMDAPVQNRKRAVFRTASVNLE